MGDGVGGHRGSFPRGHSGNSAGQGEARRLPAGSSPRPPRGATVGAVTVGQLPAPVAAPPRAEPARPRERGRRLRPAPELRRDRARPAVAGAAAAPGRAPRRPAARPQRPAARRRARPRLPRARARRPADGGRGRRRRAPPRRVRALPGAGRRPALGSGRRQRGRRPAHGSCAPALLEPPCNVLRLCLHPDGLAPRLLSLGSWRAHLLARLRHQIAATADPRLPSCSRSWVPTRSAARPRRRAVARRARRDAAAARPRRPGAGVRLTTTLFGTPGDVTVAELAIEAFLPADDGHGRVGLGAARPALRSARVTA